ELVPAGGEQGGAFLHIAERAADRIGAVIVNDRERCADAGSESERERERTAAEVDHAGDGELVVTASGRGAIQFHLESGPTAQGDVSAAQDAGARAGTERAAGVDGDRSYYPRASQGRVGIHGDRAAGLRPVDN